MVQWDVLNATHINENPVDISSTNPIGIFIGKQGTKLYHLDSTSSRCFEYDLTEPYNISTMSFVTSIAMPGGANRSLWFTADGLRLILLTSISLWELNLSTPWDLSTAVYSGTMINIPKAGGGCCLDTNMQDIFFRPDGKQVFFVGSGSSSEGTNDRIYRLDLSTGFDILTISFNGFTDRHVSENAPSGIFHKDGGRVLFMLGNAETTTSSDSTVWVFPQSSQWGFTPTSSNRLNIQAFDNSPHSLYFLQAPSPNAGARFWTMGRSTKRVHEYTMSQINVPRTFTVNAIITKDFQNSFVGAVVVARTEKEFFIGARIVLFCDTINDSTGWITTNGGTELFVDNASFPNVIHFESLAGGGGVTERWTRKDIQLSLSGDVKLEFKFDFQAMKGTGTRDSSEFRIFLQEQAIHPDNSTGSRIGCILDETRSNTHHLYGEVTDGLTTVTSIQGGTYNQRTTHVYPPNFVGGVESSVLGPYFITVELKDNKFRMSLFLDESKTIHARGSPREVDATGINPTNLQHLVISNSKGANATFSLLTGDIDNIYITKNEPIPPLSVNTQPATLVEDWESYAEFDQNPDDWVSATEPPDTFNAPFNVSSATFTQSTQIGFLNNSVGGVYMKKDGTFMWMIQGSQPRIVQTFLPNPFSLTGAIPDVSAELTDGGSQFINGIHWKDNGFRFYTIDPSLSVNVSNEGNMKEWFPIAGAFDITFGVGLVKSENTRDEIDEGRTTGISLNPLGTRLYIVTRATTAETTLFGWTNSIYQFNMDTQPFNIGNRGLVVGSLAIGNGLTLPQEMWMSDDGLKLIVIGEDQVNEYDLGTAFEINTAVFASSRNILPAESGRGVSMKPDGLRMFITERSAITPNNIVEYDIAPVVPPLIDIREVSTDFPNGGIKSFKLHTKFKGDGTTTTMSASVIGKRIATLPNPDGGDLLIPYKFTAKARSEIMSTLGTDQVKGGVYIRYEIIQGAPFDQIPNDGLSIPMFRSPSTPAGAPPRAFNDITLIFDGVNIVASLETDEPEGSYFTAEANMKDIFHAFANSNNRGWDFESHVKSISIGFWVHSTVLSSTNDIEALMYGDEINLLPVNSKTFDIGAVLDASMTKEKDFFMNKFVKAIGGVTPNFDPKEFLVDAFVQALGVNGNNGGTNPFVIQLTGDGFFTLPIGTLVGQRMDIPSAPTRIIQFKFIARREGLTGFPTGTLTGKVLTNSTPNGRIGDSDLRLSSINTINIEDITTDPAGEEIVFDFDPEDNEIPDSENIFIGFDVEGANDEISIETNSDPDTILGGDVVTEEVCPVVTNLRGNRAGGNVNDDHQFSHFTLRPLNAGSSSALPLGEKITHIRVTKGIGGTSKFTLAIYSGPGLGFPSALPSESTPLNTQLRARTAETSFVGTANQDFLDVPLLTPYFIDSTVHADIQICIAVNPVLQAGHNRVNPAQSWRADDAGGLRKRITYQQFNPLNDDAYPNFPSNFLLNESDGPGDTKFFQLLGPNVTTSGDTCFTDDSGEDAVITVTIDDERRQRCPVFVNAILAQETKELEFDLGAKVVIRQAVNCFCPNALLQAKDQEKEFFINAILLKPGVNAKLPRFNAILQAFDQEEEFFINAILVPTAIIFEETFLINSILVTQTVRQVEFFIDARVGAVVNEETFIIDAQVGLSEPQSILDVESVIGHKTGLQS